MRWLGSSALGLVVLCLAACSDPAAETPKPKDSGPDGPVVLEVFPGDFNAEYQPMTMLSAGDPVKLVAAPQGGHVVHIGARVRGLGTDIVNIRASLFDPKTHVLVREEARNIAMKPVPGEPDLMEPDLRSVSQVTHIPTCPDYEAFDIVDQTFTLETTITEVDGPGAGKSVMDIELTCQQANATEHAQCVCDCQANYVLGKCSGTPDAG